MELYNILDDLLEDNDNNIIHIIMSFTIVNNELPYLPLYSSFFDDNGNYLNMDEFDIFMTGYMARPDFLKERNDITTIDDVLCNLLIDIEYFEQLLFYTKRYNYNLINLFKLVLIHQPNYIISTEYIKNKIKENYNVIYTNPDFIDLMELMFKRDN